MPRHEKSPKSIEGCFCDECIKQRARERLAQEAIDRASNAYIERRGGLERPANSKLNPPSDGDPK